MCYLVDAIQKAFYNTASAYILSMELGPLVTRTPNTDSANTMLYQYRRTELESFKHFGISNRIAFYSV